VLGRVLPPGVISQSLGQATVGGGLAAATGGDLREVEKGALLFGVPRLFGGRVPPRRQAAKVEAAKAVTEATPNTSAEPLAEVKVEPPRQPLRAV